MESKGLIQRRLASWCQDGVHRLADPAQAKTFIDRVGLATLYYASPEVPNLFWGYMSEPDVKGDAKWDSPAGHVYTWRWDLGRSASAFYGALVAKKPTWVSWEILPTILGFAMERRDPEDLYANGLLSQDAIRLVRAFEGSSGVLSTKQLRLRGGFPTGKSERAAYLRAVEELDAMLLLAKVFDLTDEANDMSHAFVRTHYQTAVTSALALDPQEALERFLVHYLPHSIYLDAKVFSRHFRIDSIAFERASTGLVQKGLAVYEKGRLVTTIGEN